MSETLEDICFRVSEAERAMPKLRLRNNRRIREWLCGIDVSYWVDEGFDLDMVIQVHKDLLMEAWLLEDDVTERRKDA